MIAVLEKINANYFSQKLFYSPHWLVLGVNNICNLHCKMCDVGTATKSIFFDNLVGSHPLNMPPELFREIIDQAKVFFPKTKIGYAFTEPLIYSHLIETLEYASSHGFYTSVTTNALVLKQKAAAISEAGLNDIFISLDGLSEVHNQIRGHKSSFERAIAGMEALISLNKRPEISIFCCITEWNFDSVEKIYRLLQKFPPEADRVYAYQLYDSGYCHRS